MAAHRVKRLKDLVAMLERLPASPDRDRVLSEVRSRAVDVDTGVTPRAMLPVQEPAPAPLRPPQRGRASRIASASPAPAVELARPASAGGDSTEPDQLPWVDERLSLEEPPPPPVPVQRGRAVPPWTLGLRA